MLIPVQQSTIVEPGTILGRFDSSVVISNLMNIIVTGNQRPNHIARLAPTDAEHNAYVSAFLARGRMHPRAWQLVRGEKPMDARSQLEKLSREVMAMMWAFTVDMTRVDNYGKSLEQLCLASATALATESNVQEDNNKKILSAPADGEASAWSQIRVAHPAFGFERTALTFTRGISALKPHQVPTECNTWTRALAMLCFNLDLPRFAPELYPEFKVVAGLDARAEPIGRLRNLQEQLDWLAALGVLYNLQPQVAYVRMNRPFIQQQARHALERTPRQRGRIEYYLESVEAVAKLPLHPFLECAISSVLDQQANSQCGTHPCIYVDSAADIRVLDEHFLSYLLEEDTDVDISAWGDCASHTTDAPAEGGIPRTNSYGSVTQLVRRLESLGPILETAKSISARLGWSRAPDLRSGTIDLAAPDFALCDGTHYSQPPAASIAGLRPVLSCGLHRGPGLEQQFFDLAFTVNTTIEWYPMVVDGFQAPTSIDEALARHTIPAGMWMGEAGCDRIPHESMMLDKKGQRVVYYYAGKSGEYVREFYQRPVQLDKSGKPVIIPWDAAAASVVQGTAQRAMLEAYSASLVSATAQPFYSFMQAATSQRFYHRVPIRSAVRTGVAGASEGYSFYDHDGAYRYEINRGTWLRFEGQDIEVGQPATLLEAVVTNLVVIARNGAQPAIPVEDQVKA